MWRFAIWFVALAHVLGDGGARAAGPFGSIHVGNWSGGAFTSDTSGAFTHCGAATSYQNGVNLLVGQYSTGAWLLGFQHPSWQLTIGQTFPVDVTFDGQAQFHLFASALASNLMAATLPSNAAMDQFRKSHVMAAVANGQVFQFTLTSTGQLLPVIANCVAKVKAGGVANAGDFSVVAAKPPTDTGGKPDGRAGAPPKGPAPKSQQPKEFEVSGTAFAVGSKGHAVTNDHVVRDCVGDIHGNLTGQGAFKLRIVSEDETNDLALLQSPGTFRAPATIRDSAVRTGDSVVAIGFPFTDLLSSEPIVTSGIVSSLGGIGNDSRYLQISAPVQPGNSGGPLLDTSGNVIGVVSAGLDRLEVAKITGTLPENVNFAIKTGALRDFLDKSAIDYQTAAPTTELKVAEIAARARSYVLNIGCLAKDEKAKD